MDRRTFLSSALLAAAVTPGANAAAGPPVAGLIDTNVSLSHWAVRHTWAETPALLATKLRRHGVTSAWVGTFEGALHSDLAGVNTRLARACAREGSGMFHAFGTVNPALPDWEEDMRRCHEEHGMSGVRLFPNYHGYGLDDSRFRQLLEIGASRKLLIQIAFLIEDDRSQNPVLTAPTVNPAPLADLLPAIPNARVMLLNANSRIFGVGNPLLQRLSAAGVLFDVSSLEGVAGIEGVLRRLPEIRLCFGSHAPYFYFESALLKLQESVLSADQLSALCRGHAQRAIEVA